VSCFLSLSLVCHSFYRAFLVSFSTFGLADLESVCCVAKAFSDPDFQYALREEILCPTQGDDEPDYLMCMQALFARLNPPWNLTEQLNYAL